MRSRSDANRLRLKEHKRRLLASESIEDHQKAEDRYHQRLSGRYLGDFVFGANDGIITTFAIVAGSSGAGLPPSVIIILGFANLLADGISMGLGNYLGKKSERDYERAQRINELWEIDNVPEVERAELSHIFSKWGFEGADLERAIQIVSGKREAWIDIMMKHELGIFDGEPGSPLKHGAVTFAAFVIAGLVPLLPFLFQASQSVGLYVATGLSGVSLFTVGALRSRIISKPWPVAGVEILAVGAIAALTAYFIGDVVEKVVGSAF